MPNNTQILIVEDDLIVAQSIKTHLNNLGYQVPALEMDGESAVKKAGELKPDLILMDIKLPGTMDGVEAAQQIRTQFDIPIIYLTAYADEETLTRAKITEPFGYIVKPLSVKDLHSTIEMALYKYHTDKKTKHLNRILRAIRNVNQLINRDKDRDQLLQNICDSLIETRGYSTAWIVSLDSDSGDIITAAQAGFKETSSTFLEKLKQGQRPLCWQQTLEQLGVLFTEESAAHCIGCMQDQTLAGWGRMVVRLEHDTKVYGAMAVAIPQEWADDAEEQTLFIEVASDIAFALHTIREEEKRTQAETALQYSEHRYKQLLESVSDYIYTVEINRGKIVNLHHSPGCEAITGYSPEELQQNPELWLEIIYPGDRERAVEQRNRSIANNMWTPQEYRIVHLNGSIRWVRHTPVPKYDHNNQLTGYDSLVADITERKEAEEEARTSRDQLQSIFRAAPTGIGVVIDRHFIFVNERLVEMLGYTKEELIGQSSRMIYPNEEEYKRVGQIKYDQIEKQGIGTIETIFKTKDGQSIDILLSSSPIDPANLSRGVTFTALDITERKQAREALRTAELEYRTVANFTYDWEVWENPDGSLRYVSPSCERITGYTAQEFINDPELMSQIILPKDKEIWYTFRKGLVEQPEQHEIQFCIQQKDGGTRWIEHASIPVTDVQGAFLGYRSSNRDISRRKHAEAEQEKLQDQLLQAQKMEAIGRLTGGIAHDFNNLLTAINGFAELAQHKLPPDNPVQEMLKYVLDSGYRAANLVRQLLAFSRKQIIEPKTINLNALITDLDTMLRRIIGEDINIQTNMASDLWAIKVDPAQMETAIINLSVNARDAMPQGGQLILTTENTLLTKDDLAGHPETAPGEYVCLSVSDTGVGMNDDVLSNIFEPFFTTKEQGKGTGLGLATVYGIIKQSQGDIWVESQERRGTTFKIHLPRSKELAQPLSATSPQEMPQGDETVLLVEDDLEVRELTRQILERQGYKVLDAATGKEALHLAKHYPEPIDLLLTDVVMPDINGRILADDIARIRANLSIIFISGYPHETIVKHGVVKTDIVFLQKPYTASELVQQVRIVLDSSPQTQQESSGR